MLLLLSAVAAMVFFILGRGLYVGSEMASRPTPEGRRYYQICLYLYPGRLRRAIGGEGDTIEEALRTHSCSLIDR